MSEFYDDDFEVADPQRAKWYCREFAFDKCRRSHKHKRRSFYKYVCKRGWYSPMKIWHLNDGSTLMFRNRFDNYASGYPKFDSGRSAFRDDWYQRRILRFGTCLFEKADRETKRDVLLERFREARYEITRKAYRYYFSGIGRDHVPWNVLFLADSLLRLREVMKNKNRTRTKRNLVRAD